MLFKKAKQTEQATGEKVTYIISSVFPTKEISDEVCKILQEERKKELEEENRK